MIAFLLSNACISNIEVYISNIEVEKGYVPETPVLTPETLENNGIIITQGR